jgi:hypothetical protein
MHVLMAKGMEFFTGVSWLMVGFSGDFGEHVGKLF